MPADLLSHPVVITRPRDLAPLAIGLKDAARLLGVSQRHLHSLAIAGDVPSCFIGGRRVFVLESLRTWLRDAEDGNARPDEWLHQAARECAERNGQP